MKCNTVILTKPLFLYLFILIIPIVLSVNVYGQSPPVQVNNSTAGADNGGIPHSYESTNINGNKATFSIYVKSAITIHELSAAYFAGPGQNSVISKEFDNNMEMGMHKVTFTLSNNAPANTFFYISFSIDYTEISSGIRKTIYNFVKFDTRPNLCFFNYDIKYVQKTIGGIVYNYDLIIQTNNPNQIKLERNYTISALINSGNARWRDLGNNFYGFYFEQPFDLQLTDCLDNMFTYQYWPGTGSCYLSHYIRCTDTYVNDIQYNYELVINTNSPQDIVIEHTYPLDELINGNNPLVRHISGNSYGILYQNPFDLQITDCAGYSFTNQSWPNCRYNSIRENSTDLVIQTSKESINAYPNPATDFLNIQGEPNTTYDIFNSNGRFVKRINLNTKTKDKILISDWNEGIYFIKEINSQTFHKILKIN